MVVEYCCTLEMICHTMSRYDRSNMELPLRNGSINHFIRDDLSYNVTL